MQHKSEARRGMGLVEFSKEIYISPSQLLPALIISPQSFNWHGTTHIDGLCRIYRITIRHVVLKQPHRLSMAQYCIIIQAINDFQGRRSISCPRVGWSRELLRYVA